MRDALPFDDRQGVFGLELRLKRDHVGLTYGLTQAGVGRRVVERTADQDTNTGCDAVDRPHQLAIRLGLFGRRRLALHAFRMPRRARRVDQRGAAARRSGTPGLEFHEPSRPAAVRWYRFLGTCRNAELPNQLGRRRRAQHQNAIQALLKLVAGGSEQIGMSHQHFGLRVLEDVTDLMRPAVPIDRHAIGADQRGGLRRLDENEIVAQQKRNSIPLRDPASVEAAGGTCGVGQHLVAGARRSIQKNQRRSHHSSNYARDIRVRWRSA